MLTKFIPLMALALPLFSTQVVADVRGQRVELQISRIFAPEKGYDDNDNLEIIAYGHLPNACFQLSETAIEPRSDGHSYRVRQYAIRRDDGFCANGETIPPHAAMTVPFTQVVALGQHEAAGYSFYYTGTGGIEKVRHLSVSIATEPTVDKLPYAATSHALVSDVVSARDEVRVTLSGVLNSTCTYLDPVVQVSRQKDVMVLMPTLKVIPNVVCAQVLIPFQKEVNLGRFAPEEYLVHIRAMNGLSVNRVVTVMR